MIFQIVDSVMDIVFWLSVLWYANAVLQLYTSIPSVVSFTQDVGGAGTQPGANYRGKLNLGLMFTPTSTTRGNILGKVSVAIKQARDLPNMDTRSLTDGFVKCYLLPDRSASGKRKTKVITLDHQLRLHLSTPDKLLINLFTIPSWGCICPPLINF